MLDYVNTKDWTLGYSWSRKEMHQFVVDIKKMLAKPSPCLYESDSHDGSD